MRTTERDTTSPSARSRIPARHEGVLGASGGFSLVETLVAITVFVVIIGMVLTFLGRAHRSLETETGSLETQQAARVATDEVSRNIQQAGYGILRPDPQNPGAWQRDVIYAGSHAFAFNADIDASIGGLSPSNTLTFPDGSTYKGEGAVAYTGGAETYIYTIDANGDGSITTADRTAAATGSTNPAAENDNPLDYAIFRQVYGYNGSNYGGSLVPVTANLFTNATSTDLYGDGTSPNPLFSYWLTEDLNNDNNLLDNSECVVLPCPPSSARAPQLYLWGDTDFDGRLSEAEKSALRTMPVGSASWSRNRLASGGNYYSTTISTAFDPATSGSTLKVASAANFGIGQHVRIGSGGTAETFVIGSTDTTTSPQQIVLTASPANAHGVGQTVTILPQTLLRAIRTVQVAFDAITPKKDYDNSTASAAVGREGHVGTRGLEYRVRPFERKLELINLQTGAIKITTPTAPTCPTTFSASCSGNPQSTIDILTPRSTTVPVVFILKDAEGTAMSGKTVTFVNSNTSVGTLSSASAVTDSSGLATIQYTPTGTVGVDTITASNACIDNSLSSATVTSTLTSNVYKLEATLTGNDCLQTFRSGYSAPSSAFTVRVKNPAGSYANNYSLGLGLAFDTSYLPVTPDYTKVEGQLTVGGSPMGVTNSGTGSFAYNTDTGGSGTLGGSLALTKDTNGFGTRLLLTSTIPDVSCSRYGTSAAVGSRFYKMALSSINPDTSCNETAPCHIGAGADPRPSAKATLSINQIPTAPGTPVTLTRNDYYKPGASASSLLSPASGWTTDVTGDASADVYNNNDGSITVATPLKTQIDATSTGDPAVCTSGNITAASLKPEFWFEGPSAVGCDVDLQQAWIKKATANDKICIDIKNPGPTGGCDVTLIGMKFATYKTDNVTLDSTKFKVQKMNGGDNVTSTGTCSLTNTKQLFIHDCNSGADLPNNTQWNFINYTTKCYLPAAPPNPIAPQEYFVFNSVDFSDNVVAANRRFVITVYYQCAGVCSGSTQSKTFDLMTPP